MASRKRDSDGNLTGRPRSRGERRPRAKFDCNIIFTPALAVFVTAVLEQGGAVRFGLTRDGGALAVGVYGDGEPYTDYLRDEPEWLEWLDEMIEHWQRGTAEGGAGAST